MPLDPKASGLLDPRAGDIEDDASSPEKRSMLLIAGSLLAEISLPKLLVSWVVMIGFPGLLLGTAPLLLSAWLSTLTGAVKTVAGLTPLLVLAALGAFAWFAGRPAFRLAEQSFWSLNALAVQPGYALARESLRHAAELILGSRLDPQRRARLGALTAAVGGVLASAVGFAVCAWAWPYTRWDVVMSDLAHPKALVLPALANAVFAVSAMMAGASLMWGLADATMDQPRDFAAFDELDPAAPVWRVAHLSDVHVVGERFGRRIESGRAGPSGNRRFAAVLDRLAEIHNHTPLDMIVITGDMTDAGSNAEWVEFEAALARHPELQQLMLLLPGNHDVNVVDRANPARLDLPMSPFKRLRQIRTLAAMARVQEDRARVMTASRTTIGAGLNSVLGDEAQTIKTFADTGRLSLLPLMARLWADAFPMVVPPATPDGLGVILLNSNAETHFSFTNALGIMTTEQADAIDAVLDAHPRARFLVALHHHMVEYPKPAKAFSERIGTALINGTWFVRRLKPHGARIVALHGHRHIDWIGRCGPLRIVSAPSPVMGGTDDAPTHFHILRLQPAAGGRLALLAPETVNMRGEPREPA